jgi:hypothetical protein
MRVNSNRMRENYMPMAGYFFIETFKYRCPSYNAQLNRYLDSQKGLFARRIRAYSRFYRWGGGHRLGVDGGGGATLHLKM